MAPRCRSLSTCPRRTRSPPRSRPRSTQFGRLDIMFNNVGIPTPRLGMTFEDHTLEDFDRLIAVNVRGVFLGCKHAVLRFKEQGDGGVILNTGSVAGLVGWGGTVYGATKGAVHQLTKAVAIECAPFGIRVNAICPAGDAVHGLHGRRRRRRARGRARQIADVGRAPATRSAGRSPPRTAPRPPCSWRRTGPQHHRRAPAGRRRVRGAVSRRTAARPRADPRAVRPPRQLHRVHRRRLPRRPLPALARAAGDRAGATPGTVHELTGFEGDLLLPRAAVPRPPALLGVQLRGLRRTRYRNAEVFASSPGAVDVEGATGVDESACCRWAARSTAATAHWCSRRSCRPRPSGGSRNWIDETVHALIDGFVGDGRAELNVDFCAAIPVLTITGSFGIAGRAGARHPRPRSRDPHEGRRDPARRSSRPAASEPQDDLISVLVQAEITDEDGETHRLTDAEIYSFAYLLLAAGSGTTWKQMGITLAALLQRPELLDAVRERPAAAAGRHRGVGAVDADRPDVLPVGRPRTSSCYGVEMPAGAVVHLVPRRGQPRPCALGPPRRVRPDRPLKPTSGFGGGAAHLPRHARRPGRDARRDRRAARPAAEPAARPRRRAARAHRHVRAGRDRDPRACSGLSETNHE